MDEFPWQFYVLRSWSYLDKAVRKINRSRDCEGVSESWPLRCNFSEDYRWDLKQVWPWNVQAQTGHCTAVMRVLHNSDIPNCQFANCQFFSLRSLQCLAIWNLQTEERWRQCGWVQSLDLWSGKWNQWFLLRYSERESELKMSVPVQKNIISCDNNSRTSRAWSVNEY